MQVITNHILTSHRSMAYRQSLLCFGSQNPRILQTNMKKFNVASMKTDLLSKLNSLWPLILWGLCLHSSESNAWNKIVPTLLAMCSPPNFILRVKTNLRKVSIFCPLHIVQKNSICLIRLILMPLTKLLSSKVDQSWHPSWEGYCRN